jgi:hypothetical protein
VVNPAVLDLEHGGERPQADLEPGLFADLPDRGRVERLELLHPPPGDHPVRVAPPPVADQQHLPTLDDDDAHPDARHRRSSLRGRIPARPKHKRLLPASTGRSHQPTSVGGSAGSIAAICPAPCPCRPRTQETSPADPRAAEAISRSRRNATRRCQASLIASVGQCQYTGTGRGCQRAAAGTGRHGAGPRRLPDGPQDAREGSLRYGSRPSARNASRVSSTYAA